MSITDSFARGEVDFDYMAPLDVPRGGWGSPYTIDQQAALLRAGAAAYSAKGSTGKWLLDSARRLEVSQANQANQANQGRITR